ncbi:hypothetical protein FOA52_004372 [Chlamydomonas sp. UWO 241]|nr:hypothetical protein FOA52_004372 [Chlamydomonas sp. UWO 241]
MYAASTRPQPRSSQEQPSKLLPGSPGHPHAHSPGGSGGDGCGEGMTYLEQVLAVALKLSIADKQLRNKYLGTPEAALSTESEEAPSDTHDTHTKRLRLASPRRD